MKGKTNIYNSKLGGDKLHLTLTTNQSSHSDIIGAVITISYNDVVNTYTWNGTELVIALPITVEYTISFGEIANYKSPDSVSYISTVANNRFVTATYQTELVTVNVSTNNGSTPSGYTINMNGISQTTATATYKIPFGTVYSVSASSIDGYTAPSTQTFTASQVSRIVLIQYIYDPGITNPDYGIYIQSTDNKFYTASTWDQVSKTPNGIAIITDRVRLVMALHNISDSMAFSKSAVLPDINITEHDTSLEAQKNWSGYNNTQKIIKAASAYVSSTDYAPGACVNFTFPNGKKGYLGSAGEWYQLGNSSNYSEVNTLLSKVGGTTFAKNDYFWTSTLYSNAGTSWTYFWSVKCSGVSIMMDRKSRVDTKWKVRAFTTL